MPGSLLSAGIPIVRRARGFRLYDHEGKRYLDLFREGALLGHRAAAVTAMKSVLSQGLLTALPSAWEGRLIKAIARLLPGYASVRLFWSRERALAAACRCLGIRADQQEMHDPALAPCPETPPAIALWRPYLPVTPGARALLPVLPLTVCGAPAPVCFSGALSFELPRSDPLPGFLLAGALRALAALGAGPAPRCPLGGAVVERAIDRGRGWERAGPYVRAAVAPEDYRRVHAEFLRAGVLLCPEHPGPSVLPGECSPGEIRLLANLFAGIPGG